ncbi:unnamed protein product [Schistosoma rodhaini]|uniref:Putative nad dependent epimerase/dehydratase n=1 Tax=Schistosoma mansoni TaxID=6183 RepID=A0A3Q0KIY6_SCHMA|nr:unnamed protein product [Schistosoma rodhaini]
MSETSTSLLVIGAGLPRTGTKSLKEALEIIYSKPCYHMVEIVTKKHCDIGKWQTLFTEALNMTTDETMIHRGLSEILDGYVAVTDVPACAFYRELMSIYPNAKVILTVRDKNSWLSSVRHSVLPKSNDSYSQRLDKAKQALHLGNEINKMIMDSLRYAFQEDNLDIDNDEVLLECYEKYNKMVQETVPSERLLIHKLEDGWEPLCQFLNVTIPDGIAYPHVNTRDQIKELMELIGKNASPEDLEAIFPEFHDVKFGQL